MNQEIKKQKLKEKLTKWLIKEIEKYNKKAKIYNLKPFSFDLFDLEAYIDTSISYSENKDLIKNVLKQEFNVNLDFEKELLNIDKYEYLEQKYLEKLQEQEEERIRETLKQEQDLIITETLEVVRHYTNMVIKGYSYGLIITGAGGFGKTAIVVNEMAKNNLVEGKDYVYYSGHITPLKLYKLLYNNNGKIIILDDVDLIKNGAVSLNILKSALWDVAGQRIISYESSSKLLDIPSKFIFEGRIIYISNYIPNLRNINIQALLSRTLYVNLNLPIQEQKAIIKEIVSKEQGLTQEEKEEIIKEIENRINYTNVSFRTIKQIISIYKYSKEQGVKGLALINPLLQEDEDIKAFIEAYQQGANEKERVKIFTEISGKSRRTYFRIKKEARRKGIVP